MDKYDKGDAYKMRPVEDLEPYYSRHIAAMTREKLNAKSDIAAELACRDWKIERLLAENEELSTENKNAADSLETLLAEGTLKDAVVAAAIAIRNGQAEPKFAVDRQLWAALDALSSASGRRESNPMTDAEIAAGEHAYLMNEEIPADSRQPEDGQ
jgi:hypothetical protein